MRRLAHLSDLHFGRVDKGVVEALVEELNAAPPDLVVVSGDLTQRGSRAEFSEARAFLDRLQAPVFVVPGNHDITAFQLAERFLNPYSRWRRYIARETEPVWHDDRLAVVGLNTARRMALHWNWAHGRVNRGQLDRLGHVFDALPRHLFRVVVAHHPFLPPEDAPDTRLVGRAKQALKAFASYGVGLVLSGHLHQGYMRHHEPAQLFPRAKIGAGAEARPRLLVVQAATATSTRLRDEPNAYNRITITDGEAKVQVRVWDGRTWCSAGTSRREVDAVAI